MSLSVPSAPQGKTFHCFVCGVIYENKKRTRVGIFDVPKTKLLIGKKLSQNLSQNHGYATAIFTKVILIKDIPLERLSFLLNAGS